MDDTTGYTPPKKTLTKRGTLLSVDREVFDVHVVVGINPTAQEDVCASTVHFIYILTITAVSEQQKSNVCTGNISDLRTASERCVSSKKSLIIFRAC